MTLNQLLYQEQERYKLTIAQLGMISDSNMAAALANDRAFEILNAIKRLPDDDVKVIVNQLKQRYGRAPRKDDLRGFILDEVSWLLRDLDDQLERRVKTFAARS